MSILHEIILSLGAGLGGVLAFWQVCEGQAQKKIRNAMLIENAEYRGLTAGEQNAYDVLLEVRGSNAWALVVQDIMGSGDVGAFRELLDELHEQGGDNPALMQEIIGGAAWQAVKEARVKLHVVATA